MSDKGFTSTVKMNYCKKKCDDNFIKKNESILHRSRGN